MKQLIRSLLREFVSNQKMMDDYISDFIDSVKKVVPHANVEKQFRGGGTEEIYITDYDEKTDSDKLNKIVRICKEKLLRVGIILGFEENKKGNVYKSNQFFVSFKNVNTRRIKPNRFVFHSSEVDPSIILKDGLKPISSDKGRWKHYVLSYPDSIFAVNTYDEIWSSGNVYVIDTSKISNSWWYDLNEFKETNLDYAKKLIMTFEPISPDAIGILPFDEMRKITQLAKEGLTKKELEHKIETLLSNNSSI